MTTQATTEQKPLRCECGNPATWVMKDDADRSGRPLDPTFAFCDDMRDLYLKDGVNKSEMRKVKVSN